MLLEDADFPEAVLEILTPESRWGTTHGVFGFDFGAEEDAAAGGAQAIVEFIILVANEFFIEEAEALKNPTRPGTHVNGVHPLFIIGIVKTATANSKG